MKLETEARSVVSAMKDISIFLFLSVLVLSFSLILVSADSVIQNYESSNTSSLTRYFQGYSNQSYSDFFINLTFLGSSSLSNFSSVCFQESANTSNQTGLDSCSVNYSGSYNVTSTYFYINYSKPSNYTGAYWSVKHGNGSSGFSPYNSSIPFSCFNYDSTYLILRIYSNYNELGDFTQARSKGQCLSSFGWLDVTQDLIGNTTSTSSGGSYSDLFDGNYSTNRIGGSFLSRFSSDSNSAFDINYARVYEESIYWLADASYQNSNGSINLSLSDAYVFNSSFVNNETKVLSNLSLYVNNILPSCNCVGCIYNSSDLLCSIPINITAVPYPSLFSYNSSYNLVSISSGGGSSNEVCIVVDCSLGNRCIAVVPGCYWVSDNTPTPPFQDFFNFLLSGANLKAVLIAWEPTSYKNVVARWDFLTDPQYLIDIPSNFVKFVLALVDYMFRQPASLIPDGGAGNV